MDRAQTALQNKLQTYLQRVMPAAEDVEVRNLKGMAFGASRETYTFDVCWRESGQEKKQGLVLRRDLPAGLLDHVPRATEFKILRSLEGTGIPAPRALFCESDPAILERPFIIMERTEGMVTQAFQNIAKGNRERAHKLAEQYVSLPVRIHDLDWRERGLEFLGPPAHPHDYAGLELAKWEKIMEKVRLEPDPILLEARLWLRRNLPPAAGVSLVHGDYKMDNVMYQKDEITAILDWELASLGDFHDDLGWICMRYYEVDGLLQGLMERAWFLSRYEEMSGRRLDPAALRFWQVFANFKMAVITLTGTHRYVTGAARKNTLAVISLLMPKLHQDLVELLEF
jgi:aminoglycoside phosphotransferase (APT) family kinase protein